MRCPVVEAGITAERSSGLAQQRDEAILPQQILRAAAEAHAAGPKCTTESVGRLEPGGQGQRG
jgi:hypothetical protein